MNMSAKAFMQHGGPDMHIPQHKSIPSLVMVAISAHVSNVCLVYKIRCIVDSLL